MVAELSAAFCFLEVLRRIDKFHEFSAVMVSAYFQGH